MKGLAGLKRGLGYFTSRSRLPDPVTNGLSGPAQPWESRLAEALEGAALATRLEAACDEVGGAASAVVTALGRMARDQQDHVRLCTAVVQGLGGTVPTSVQAPGGQGDALERSAQLILGPLCVGMTARCTASAAARDRAEGPAHALLDRITRDQIAHADLGFMLWPIVRHTWEQRRSDDADAMGRQLVNAALADVDDVVRTRLQRRFKSMGLEL